MSINLDQYRKCSLPRTSISMSQVSVLHNLHDLVMNFSGRIDIKKPIGERDFIYELLTRSDTDLRSAQRRIDDAVDGTETNNELKTRWR